MEKEQVKASLFDKLPLLDKNRATKFIIYGLLIAVIFGIMMMVSRSIANNATAWADLANQENNIAYWSGAYGYNDYIHKQAEITEIRYWMAFQDVIFMNIARIGINIGLIFVLIGFLSFAVNEKIDEHTRKISLIIAGLVLFLMMFTTFFSSLFVSIS
jgi:protein-S-isoprenylcysteine O-methyltransferase Ste14